VKYKRNKVINRDFFIEIILVYSNVTTGFLVMFLPK
jgi:hypothetical protein